MILDIITFIHDKQSSMYAENLRNYAEKLKCGNNILNWKYIQSGEYECNPNGFSKIGETEKLIQTSYSHGD